MRPIALFLLLLCASPLTADTFTPYTAENVPKSAAALWADVDPGAEPLDIKVIKEWDEDGVTTRYLIYTVCTHSGTPCQVAAFYTFPTGAKKAPAFVWAHGGGQRADRKRGTYFAKRGYATIDYNWGGREMVEGIEANTDWGKLDPSQGPKFYPGALRKSVKLNHQPDEHTIDPVVSPRNGNWFLLALAGRRAITLLEQQPEVDPGRIGFTGYSMGGNITSYCAIDPRLKAVAPMVGGTGHITLDFPGLPGTSRAAQYRDPAQFAATMDSAAYWPLVRCPVLFLNATNDFHGILEYSYRCVALLPHDNWHASYNPHYSHSLRSEQYAALNLFFDEHLKGVGKGLASTAELTPFLIENDSVLFSASPDPERMDELVSIEVFYSHDPNPRTRHWKTSARATRVSPDVNAVLPLRPHLPLFAFANFTYRLPKPELAFEDQSQPAEVYTVTSPLAVHYPKEIKADTLRDSATQRELFHDFRANGVSGWGSSSRRNALRTYRFQDPDRATPPKDAELVLSIDPLPQPVQVRLRISGSEWLKPRTPKSSYSAAKAIPAGAKEVRILVSDFRKAGDRSTRRTDWESIVSFEFEIIQPDNHNHPIDLTREANRGFLKDLVWE